MKKLFYFAAAAVALAACAKNEVIPVNSGENQEITFNVAPKTKADPQTFNTGNVFASWAYYLPKNKTWDANWKEAVEYIGTEHVGSTISFKNNVWKDQTTSYYWPKEGSLTFFAYSLNSNKLAETECYFYCEKEAGNADGSTKDQYGITGSLNLDAHSNTDFLVADIAPDKTANVDKYKFNGVPTLFRHRLSRVKFAVKKQSDYKDVTFTLNSIQFCNLSKGMNYTQFKKNSDNVFEEVLDPFPATSIQKYTKGEDIAFTVSGTEFELIPEAKEDRYIYIPQPFSPGSNVATNAYIEVKYTITTTVKVTTPEGTSTNDVVEHVTKNIFLNPEGENVTKMFDKWEMGKKYTINLTFTLDEILWAPAVQDWDDVNIGTGINTDKPIIVG